jgi:hypothetical protein
VKAAIARRTPKRFAQNPKCFAQKKTLAGDKTLDCGENRRFY